ncbi:MAG: cation:proton antiporter [Chlamydiales bacterium]
MQIQQFFLHLVLILLSARVLGELAARMNIPSVIGELLAGILIGPSILNLIEPTETIKLLAEMGIILLLFEVGLEADIGKLAKTGYRPFVVAIGGVVVPFFLGFWISYQLFNLSLLVSLLIGSTLTATSIGITIRVLTDLRKKTSDEAQIVLGAAVIDDIIGIILLSIIYEFARGGGISFLNVGKIFLFICLFLVLAPIAAKLISSTIKNYEEKSQIPGLLPTTIVSLILFFAWLAHEVGAPALLGGFAAGLAISKQFFLPFGSFFAISEKFSHEVETEMKPIVHLFTPIFFVTIGLSLNLREIMWNSMFLWVLSIALLAAAILGKLSSGFLLIKDSKWIKWAVGIAMIPRGEVGLIFAEVGRTNNIFDNELYASMIIIIAITTVFTPFVMRFFYNYQRRKEKETDPAEPK